MNAVITELNNNLKLLYRQAIDADTKLDSLQQQGKGKFSALFTEQSVFEISAKRFKPYVLEVASDVDALSKSEAIEQQAVITVVKKIEELHKLLATFK